MVKGWFGVRGEPRRFRLFFCQRQLQNFVEIDAIRRCKSIFVFALSCLNQNALIEELLEHPLYRAFAQLGTSCNGSFRAPDTRAIVAGFVS